MRFYSFDPATADIKMLFTITRRDEVVIRFASALAPITVGALTWVPAPGLKPFNISERNDGTPASTQLMLSVTSGGLIDPQDLADQQFDGAILEIDLVDANHPTALDFHFYGQIGARAKPLHGAVTFEVRNPFPLQRQTLVPTFTVMCRFPFGGTMCGIPVMRPLVARSTAYQASPGAGFLGDCVRVLTGTSPVGFGNVYFEVTTSGITASSAPSYNYTIGGTTTDGSVVFTARNAFERACEIATVVDRHNLILTADPDSSRDVDGWYAPGKLMFVTGRNKNRIVRIGAWIKSALQLTTWLPAGLQVVAGDKALIWPDCDKTLTMCRFKYSNARRFGGFPYFEGAKAASQVGS